MTIEIPKNDLVGKLPEIHNLHKICNDEMSKIKSITAANTLIPGDKKIGTKKSSITDYVTRKNSKIEIASGVHATVQCEPPVIPVSDENESKSLSLKNVSPRLTLVQRKINDNIIKLKNSL